MLLSGVRLFVTPWIIVHGLLQARIVDPVPFPSPGNLPNLGIKPRSPALQADSLPAEPPGKAEYMYTFVFIFWPPRGGCGIPVLPLGIEPLPLASAAWRHNHWTAREVPTSVIVVCCFISCFLRVLQLSKN